MAEENSLIGLQSTPIVYHLIEDTYYLDIHTFAKISKRTIPTIRSLIQNGNRIRKLRATRVGTMYYIPVAEYFIFPFITSGKGDHTIRHFNKKGDFVVCEQCTAGLRCPKVDVIGEWNNE